MWSSLSPWPDAKCSKTVEDWSSCSSEELKPCQHEIATDETLEEEEMREHSNIKARVSVHERAQCHTKWPWAAKSFSTLQDSNPCCATCLDHYAKSCLLKKKIYYTSQPWANYLCIRSSNCSSRISKSGRIHQNSWQQTFDRPILSRLIQIGLIGVANFSLNVHQAGHLLHKSEQWELQI